MLILAIIYFVVSLWLLRYFFDHDRGAKEPRPVLWASVAFGVLAVVLAIVLEVNFLPEELSIEATTDTVDWQILFIGFMGVGLIEELAKFLPLALFINKKSYFNEATDGIIYFGITALTFALIEDFFYIVSFGPAAGYGRLLSGPFLHVALTVLIGWALARRKVLKSSYGFVLVMFVLSVVLHGVFDFFLSVANPIFPILALLISLALNFYIFRLYSRAQKVDEKLGISAVGSNRFCRVCGKPNTHKMLYCEFCGQKT